MGSQPKAETRHSMCKHSLLYATRALANRRHTSSSSSLLPSLLRCALLMSCRSAASVDLWAVLLVQLMT